MNEREAEVLLAGLLSREAVMVGRQVRLGGKIVDLVVQWPSGEAGDGDVETIEVKLHDWRRAARQAYSSSAYVRHASIAMPANARRKIDMTYLQELGIGLIEFDGGAWWRVVAPAQQRDQDPAMAEHLRSRIVGRS